MSRGRVLGCVLGLFVVAVVAAPAAVGGKPTFERIPISESLPDDFLSDACGVAVTTRAEGHIIVRTFSNDGTAGVVRVQTINIALTATAGGNTYGFRDVGADVERVSPDGTEILLIIGQVPFTFTGVLKINLTTGDAILEPHHSLEGRLEEACAALTAD